MKISKILFFFVAIIAVKLFIPGYVLAGSSGSGGVKKLTDAQKKKKNIIIFSSVASVLAALIGAGVGFGIYYKNHKSDNKDEGNDKKGSNDSKNKSQENKTPLLTAKA
ncbi:early transcribed membrane protein 10.1 [Plasmodium reichenowi]|uniref:Early transcribed membrane protein 10.1 n=1 Tax=Plasmodium reichenowi TaxID=5854 RepID=A0A060RSU8_PLARE|nr:early transcribed membrane protein 10.1 [Plasmodium reichenowi]KYN97463.1 early transcribed membrane protein 10.1 [Plasmodium reichenowi]CDO64446.1 early transcribed membrane protein 10.1 [Plasmodium reichenowi]SOV79605.1 early transcribed membrane protein 10.1 [Plasmodium reichenowi]